MKARTKDRIIYLVKKLINYQEPFRPPMVIETRKVQLVRFVHQYPEGELKMISEDQVRYTSNMALIDELEKNKFIEYAIDHENNRVEARLKVILP